MPILIGACFSAAAERTDSRSYLFQPVPAVAGLPENTINAMAQTPDGYIWCATFNGLARFDGVRFEVFDPSNTPELPTDRLIKLGVTRSGTLIIVTEFGDVVLLANGRFKRCRTDRSHRNDAIVEDGAGRLWASSLQRTVQDWEPLDHDGHGGMKGPLRTALWLTYTNNGPCVVRGNTLIAQDQLGLRTQTWPGAWEPMKSPLPGGTPPTYLAGVPGGAWLASSNAFYFFDGDAIKRTIPLPPEDYGRGIFCDAGPLWVMNYPKFARIDLQKDALDEIIELPEGSRSLINLGFIDREENLWLSQPGEGLLRVRRSGLRRYGKKDGLWSDIVRSVGEDAHGGIWAVTTGGINIISQQGVRSLPYTHGVIPWTVIPARSGGMWLATYSAGLFHCGPEGGQLVPAVPFMSWDAPDFTFLTQDSTGTLWFGSAAGLFSFDGTNVAAQALPVDSPPDMRALTEAADGTLFAGSNGKGLFARKPGTKVWKRYTADDGLLSEQIYCLHAEPDGTLWLGTSGAGLARFDGRRFVFFRDAVKVLPRTITGIVSDELGFLWIGSASGLARVRMADLNAAANDPNHPVALVEYGARAGLQHTESVVGIQPSLIKARDGRIWVATTGGVICIDPRRIPVNPLPPPVVIERVRAEDAQVDLAVKQTVPAPNQAALISVSDGRQPTVTIRAGADPVDFEFTALSFTAPENVQFRYRIEGLDSKWTRTRERHALYQHLPPGRYTFHVIACNNDGIWNSQGARLAVVQLPFYWQTTWFKLAVVLVVAGLLYAAFRFRLAQLARVGRLRARIAADLHDEVGSNLGAVVLNSDLLTMSPNLSASEREQVQDIHRLARNTADAIREISWFINPDFDFLDEMIVRMKEAAGRFSKGHPVRFCAPERLPKVRLGLEFRRNVMAIFKESLTNAARHSEAEHIEITIGLEAGRLDLVIRDDGRGFAAGQENGGQGLRNLRQRAAAIGGKLEITSQPGAGAQVRFSAELR